MNCLLAALFAAFGVALWVAPQRRVLSRMTAARGPADAVRRHRRAEQGTRWGLAAVAGLGAATIAPALGVALGIAAVVVPPAARRARDRRLTAARSEVCAEIVHALAAELRAGHPPGAALAAVAVVAGPLREELTTAAHAAALGSSAATELRTCADLPGAESLRAVAAAWEVIERAGGPVADVLDRVGVVLEADEVDRRAFAADTAAPRATVVLLAALPVLAVGLGQASGAHPVRLLLHDRLGWMLLGGAALLDGVGIAWMRRLLRIAG